MENKDWKEEFREYFDKVLKAKKPTIENLDREILVNAVSRILKSKQEEIGKPLEIVADFVERWNKQDEDKEVAQAVEKLLSIKEKIYETKNI